MSLVNIEDAANYGQAWEWAYQVSTGQLMYAGPAYNAFGYNQVYVYPGLPEVGVSSLSLEDDSYSNNMTNILYGMVGGGAKNFNYLATYNTKDDPISLKAGTMKGAAYNKGGSNGFNTVELTLIPKTNNIKISQNYADATISNGVISHSQKEQVDTYKFFANVKPAKNGFSKLFLQTNSATYNTTKGTAQSKTISGQTSFSTTDSVSASVGAGPFSAEASSSVTQGWQKAWSNMSSVSFSQGTGTKDTTSSGSTININPFGTADNSNFTYEYTTEVPQPDGSTQLVQTKFLIGAAYQANVIKTQHSINNNLSGSYTISGSMGTLSDSQSTGPNSRFGGSINMSAADAIYKAASANYGLVNGNQPVHSLTNYGQPNDYLSGFDLRKPAPSSPTSIDFNGTAAGTSIVGNDFSVVYTEDASASSSKVSSNRLESDSSNSASSSKVSSNRLESDSSDIDLNKFDSTKEDGLGVSYTFREDSNGSKAISGTGDTDIAHASTNGEHTFSKFTDSFLHGNDNNDVFDLDRKASANSIFALGGNDKIKSSSSQTASMGEGNDIYVINSDAINSFHQILLGNGEDEVIVDSAKAKFTIGDFNPFMDTVKVGASLEKDLLTGKLVPFENGKEILDNAKIQFYYDGSPIGVAFISNENDFIQDFVDPFKQQNIYKLNTDESNNKSLKDGLSAYEYFAVSVKEGFAYSRPTIPTGFGSLGSMDDVQRAQTMGLENTQENFI